MSTIPPLYTYQEELDALDWSAEMTIKFGRKVLLEYTTFDEDDAKMARGMRAYLVAVKTVRKLLAPHGWRRKCEGNVELVVHPQKKLAICVSSANKYTGRQDGTPHNRNKKGSECAHLVYQNQRQLFLPLKFGESHSINVDEYETWFLLYFFDKDKKELRIELSLPLVYNWQEKIISGYKYRIPFTPLPVEVEFIPPIEDETEEWNEFTIKVRQNE